jgi:hypothetical protein
MPNCLLCGAGVWYIGLFNADCTNKACTNYREQPAPKKPSVTYGTWAWARKRQIEGWRLEWRISMEGDWIWEDLDERLDDDPPEAENEPYVYRVRQKYYEYRSSHPQGSVGWALDQQATGARTYFNGRGYEIVP